MTWLECLDYFGYSEYFYYAFIILLISLIVSIISAFWWKYYKFSKIIPRPDIQIIIYVTYSLKSLSGLSFGCFPLMFGILFLNEASLFISVFKTYGRGDYRLAFEETSENEIETTRIGRFALGMFTIGIYAVRKGIELLLPDIRKSDLKVKRKSEFARVELDNKRKKAYLYFSTLMGVAFASTFF